MTMVPIRLHSKYNPHREAEQFAAAIEGSPAVIVITEPGESYLAPCLRKRFPSATLIAVRYTDDLFLESDSLWDTVWRPAVGNLRFFLVRILPDELLASVRFIPWKPADRAFPDAARFIWEEISGSIEILKSLMCTRAFFGKRWLKNTVKNAARVSAVCRPQFGTANILLTGAGPSLKDLYADDVSGFSIAAVGSAYRAVTYQGIRPHLCITADAGYWALRHLDTLDAEIPLAFPLEAAVPSKVLDNNPCILLSYGSPLEQELFSLIGYRPIPAQENGTVMGTAVELMLAGSEKAVCIAGLDLAASQGFSHARPHQSSSLAAAAVNRCAPLADRLAVQNFNTVSLETYRQWFLQLPPDKTRRLYRIGSCGAPLPNITSIGSSREIPPQARGNTVFSVKSAAITDHKKRKKALSLLLAEMQTRIRSVIFGNPLLLKTGSVSIEKQLCSLAAYTSYVSFLKESENPVLQKKLSDEVSLELSRLADSL